MCVCVCAKMVCVVTHVVAVECVCVISMVFTSLVVGNAAQHSTVQYSAVVR